MSSKNIQFLTIPSGIKKPGQYIEFNTRTAVRTLPANIQNVLLIGQRTSAGTVAQLVPTQLFSSDDAATFFGAGSILDLMAREAIGTYPYLNLFAIAVDDNSGGAARVGTVTAAGTVTGTGWVRLWIGQRYAQVSYISTDDGIDIATALKEQLDTMTGLPFTYERASGVLTLTARNKGTQPNHIPITCEVSIEGGATLTWAQTTVGSGDPDLHATGGILDTILPVRYHVIASSLNDETSLGYIADYLTIKSGPIEMKPEVCWAGLIDTVANAETLSDAVNHERIFVAHLKACKTPPFQIAAACAAVDASYSDPAYPRDFAELPTVVAPGLLDRSSRTEQEALLNHGITPLEVGDGETVEIVRMVSTYQTDVSYLDGTTIKSLDYTRDAMRIMVRNRYQPGKMDADRQKDLKEDLIATAKDLEDLNILENIEQHRDEFFVEEDLQNPGQLNAKIPAEVVKGLHVFAAEIDLIL
jgi:phage tail sheath gpL-like